MLTREDALEIQIRSILDKDIRLTRNAYDDYEYEIYPAYDDRFGQNDVVEIAGSDYPEMRLEEMLTEAYDGYYDELANIKSETVNALQEESEEGLDSCDYDIIDRFFEERVYIKYPIKHFLDCTYHVNIFLDTGDGNYDFTLNSVYPSYCQDEPSQIDKKAGIVFLAKTQGYRKTELSDALNKGEVKDSKFLKSMFEEVENISSNINVVTFLVEMTLNDIIQLNKLVNHQEDNGHKCDATKRPYCGYIVLDKSVMSGLYDHWNGGGSILELQFEKDIKIPVKYIRSALPDGCDGYSIDKVYGLCSSAWKDAVKEIHVPLKYRDYDEY